MTGNATRKYPTASLRFQAAAPAVDPAAPAGGERKNARVSGIANSGSVMPGFFGPVVVDLESAQIARRPQIPILYDHHKPIGFASSMRVTASGLEYEGEIIDADSNEEGRRVIDFARSGMQWQMSCMAIPTTVEMVPPGGQVRVNGRDIVGPVEIFRGSEIRELTITPAGRDDQTRAEVFDAAAEGVVVPVTRFAAMAEQDDKAKDGGGAPQTVDDLAKQFPALVELIKEQARNEGYQKGQADERSRADGTLEEAEAATKPEVGKDGKATAAPATAIAASLQRARFHVRAGTAREGVKADFESLRAIGMFSVQAASAPDRAERFKADPIDEVKAEDPEQQDAQDDVVLRAQFSADKALVKKFGGDFESFAAYTRYQQQRKGA